MHELGIIQSALELAQAEAQKIGGRITRLTLRVGRLSGVEPEALRFAFLVESEGTLADGADLEIEPVPVRCLCPACGGAFFPLDLVFCCPFCAAMSSTIESGRELELTSVEVDCDVN